MHESRRHQKIESFPATPSCDTGIFLRLYAAPEGNRSYVLLLTMPHHTIMGCHPAQVTSINTLDEIRRTEATISFFCISTV